MVERVGSDGFRPLVRMGHPPAPPGADSVDQVAADRSMDEGAPFLRVVFAGFHHAGCVFEQRHERIVQDIGEICAQVFGATGGDDRTDMVEQLAAQFAPGNVVEIAFATDRELLAGR